MFSGITLRGNPAGRIAGRLAGRLGRLRGGLVGAVVTGAMQPTPSPHPALLLPAAHLPARHYKKARRTLANAAARTTVPCTSRSTGTETGWAVGTFMRERTAETGVPGPR